MKKFQSVRGMRDILQIEAKSFRHLENNLISVTNQFGFEEIKTPILEDTNLFIKSIGDGTDIVEKEMYTFHDSRNNPISMRPEGTASCVRALIEHGKSDIINKVWYSGPFFRHERPQKGRYRQFHQFGVEFTGVGSFEADFEIINLANQIWDSLNIKPTLLINSIGDIEDRKKYIEVLLKYLKKYESDFDDSEKNKLKSNPLRILDTKSKKIKKILESAPNINDYLSGDAKSHFNSLLELLDDKKIPYIQNSNLVRGLDYYNRTVFEYLDNTENSQNTICAGGRYDYLFKSLCDREVPAAGFAIGIERLMDFINFPTTNKHIVQFYLIVLDEENHSYSQTVAKIIRSTSEKFTVLHSYSYKNLKTQLKKADKLSLDYCVIIGNEERKKNICQIKKMNSGEQENICIDKLPDFLKEKIIAGIQDE